MLCPGFIDLHTHSALRSFDDPLLTPKLAQGFTTEVINPDGLAPAPVSPERRAERQAYLRPLEGGGPETWPWSTVEEYLDALDATRPALSLVPSIGHGAVRELVLGSGRVAPTAENLRDDAARGSARARGRRAHALVRARLPAGRLRRHRRARRGRRGGGRLRRAARAACPERGQRAARGRCRDDRRRPPLGRPTPRLAPEVARRREPDRAAARAARERRHRARRHVRPVPVRRRQHLAREHPARLGAGGRRGRHAADDRQPRRPAPHRARDRQRAAGLGEHPRHARARADRDRERSATERGRHRQDAGGRSVPSAAATRSPPPST